MNGLATTGSTTSRPSQSPPGKTTQCPEGVFRHAISELKKAPTRIGQAEDGSWSAIWKAPGNSMRIRRGADGWVMNEYEGKISRRQVTGSIEFVLVMACQWLKHHGPGVASPGPTGPDSQPASGLCEGMRLGLDSTYGWHG